MPATSHRLDVYQRRDLLEEISREVVDRYGDSQELINALMNRPSQAGERVIQAVERLIDEVTR